MVSRAHRHAKNLQPLVENPNVTYTPPFGGPSTPSVITPANGASSQGMGFVLSAYSHPSGVPQAGIQIQRATNNTFTLNMILSPIAAGTTSTASVASSGYTAGTVAYVRARYIDTFGQPSDWSAPVSYVQTNNPEVSAQARSGNANAASHSLTFTGSAIGELIIILVAANTVPTTPSGFTAQGSYSSVLSGSSTYVYSKVATANNESVTVSVGGAAEVIGCVLRYASAYPGGTMFAQAKTAASSYAIQIPSAGAGKWALVMGFCRSPSANITMPSGAGWTTIYNLSTQSGSSYFTPLIAWAPSLAAGNITRASTTYEAWQMTLTF